VATALLPGGGKCFSLKGNTGLKRTSARPASFRSLLTSLGAVVAADCIYPDHYHYQKTDLAGIFKKAADHGVNMIVTTEKDAVRLRGLEHDGIWALRIELFVNEQKEWQTFLLNNL
jgi:tetraacyldisaccharide 4'-kinase